MERITLSTRRHASFRRTLNRLMAQRAREIASSHYEPGNWARCYKRVWLRYAATELGMNYRTFLRYVKQPDDEIDEA